MTKTELNKLLSKLLYQMCLNYGTALFVGIMLLAILGTVERVFNHWRNK